MKARCTSLVAAVVCIGTSCACAVADIALELTGTARYRGNDVPFMLVSEGLQFGAAFGGAMPYAVGFDAHDVWERDQNTSPRTLSMGERDATLLANWVVTGAWADERAPLTRSEAVVSPSGETTEIAFTLDGSPISGVFEVERATGLLQRASWTSGRRGTTVELSGYGELAGAQDSPSRVTQTSEGSAPLTIEFTEARSVGTHAAFAPPSSIGAASFDTAMDPQLEVKSLEIGLLLVRAHIAGEDAGWFIFDTGAGTNVISTPVAQARGMKRIGEGLAMGVGGTASAAYYAAPSLRVGPATLPDPTFLAIDLSFLEPHAGVPINGIIGYDLLSQAVVEFDAGQASIALFDPNAYKPQRDWQKLLIYNRQPCIDATFEGEHGVFMLDTGAANTAVTFGFDAVREHDLLNRDTRDAALGGVGGQVAAKEGTLESFEIGGRRSEGVAATFVVEPEGAFADPYLTGSVGGQLIRSAVLVLDYSRERIALVER